MKVDQFRKVVETAEQLYLDSGNAPAAGLLCKFSSLFAGRETMTVAAFATLIAKVTAAENAQE